MRWVTLCADDYALSPAVSAGIREALAAGRLSATSAMTNRPDWPSAARALEGLRGAIGLHVNLTLGSPLAAMQVLAPGGSFPAIGTITRAALTGRLPLAEIRLEIERQIDAFEQALGRPPAFIDGHQHVHALPGIRSVLIDAVRHRQLDLWLRDPGDRFRRILARRVEVPKAAAIAMLSSGFRDVARTIRTNDGFAGFSSFRTDRDYAANFASYLRWPGERHLVMCHPGHVDNELAMVDPVTKRREQELTFLLSHQFVDILGRETVQLVAA